MEDPKPAGLPLRAAAEIEMACHDLTPIKALALAGSSPRAIARCLPELHELTLQTLLLRSGLRLGAIKAA